MRKGLSSTACYHRSLDSLSNLIIIAPTIFHLSLVNLMLDQAKLTSTLGLFAVFAWSVLILITPFLSPLLALVDSYMVVSLLSPPERPLVAYI